MTPIRVLSLIASLLLISSVLKSCQQLEISVSNCKDPRLVLQQDNSTDCLICDDCVVQLLDELESVNQNLEYSRESIRSEKISSDLKARLSELDERADQHKLAWSKSHINLVNSLRLFNESLGLETGDMAAKLDSLEASNRDLESDTLNLMSRAKLMSESVRGSLSAALDLESYLPSSNYSIEDMESESMLIESRHFLKRLATAELNLKIILSKQLVTAQKLSEKYGTLMNSELSKLIESMFPHGNSSDEDLYLMNLLNYHSQTSSQVLNFPLRASRVSTALEFDEPIVRDNPEAWLYASRERLRFTEIQYKLVVQMLNILEGRSNMSHRKVLDVAKNTTSELDLNLHNSSRWISDFEAKATELEAQSSWLNSLYQESTSHVSDLRSLLNCSKSIQSIYEDIEFANESLDEFDIYLNQLENPNLKSEIFQEVVNLNLSLRDSVAELRKIKQQVGLIALTDDPDLLSLNISNEANLIEPFLRPSNQNIYLSWLERLNKLEAAEQKMGNSMQDSSQDSLSQSIKLLWHRIQGIRNLLGSSELGRNLNQRVDRCGFKLWRPTGLNVSLNTLSVSLYLKLDGSDEGLIFLVASETSEDCWLDLPYFAIALRQRRVEVIIGSDDKETITVEDDTELDNDKWYKVKVIRAGTLLSLFIISEKSEASFEQRVPESIAESGGSRLEIYIAGSSFNCSSSHLRKCRDPINFRAFSGKIGGIRLNGYKLSVWNTIPGEDSLSIWNKDQSDKLEWPIKHIDESDWVSESEWQSVMDIMIESPQISNAGCDL